MTKIFLIYPSWGAQDASKLRVIQVRANVCILEYQKNYWRYNSRRVGIMFTVSNSRIEQTKIIKILLLMLCQTSNFKFSIRGMGKEEEIRL